MLTPYLSRAAELLTYDSSAPMLFNSGLFLVLFLLFLPLYYLLRRHTLARIETVAKVNSLTILLARLSRLCRKDEAQGAEGEV